jgi:hypothetical protein
MKSSSSKKSKNNDADELMKIFLDLSTKFEQQDSVFGDLFRNLPDYKTNRASKIATDTVLEAEKAGILNQMFFYALEIAKNGNIDQFRICKEILLKHSPNSLINLNFLEGIVIGENVKKKFEKSSNIFDEKSPKAKDPHPVQLILDAEEEYANSFKSKFPHEESIQVSRLNPNYTQKSLIRENNKIGEKQKMRVEKLAEKNRKANEKQEMKNNTEKIDDRVEKQNEISNKIGEKQKMRAEKLAEKNRKVNEKQEMKSNTEKIDDRVEKPMSNANKSQFSSFLTKLLK